MVVSASTKLVVIIVFLLYAVALLVIGWLYKRKLDKQKGEYTDNFYTGGRAMGALLVAMMVAAGICSAGTFVGSPGKIYSGGLSWGAVVPGQMLMNLMVLSYFMTFGFFNPGYPHAVIGCMSYNSTRKMNTAIKIGVVLVAVWSLSLSLLAGIIRNVFPDLAVSDYALPTLAVAALPHWVAGLTLAGVIGALQSTVGTMVIVMSAAVVKDLYQSVIKPDASPRMMKSLTKISTVVITLVIFVLSLTPPDNLQNVVIYAVGGMVSAFYTP